MRPSVKPAEAWAICDLDGEILAINRFESCAWNDATLRGLIDREVLIQNGCQSIPVAVETRYDWIPVSPETMPRQGQEVEFCVNAQGSPRAVFRGTLTTLGSVVFFDAVAHRWSAGLVSHWRPTTLPTLPEGVE